MQTQYKSDNAIAAEFDGFKIISIEKTNRGDYATGYITIEWPNGDESVGGGIEEGGTTIDSFIDYDNNGARIAFDSWYPENVYKQLCAAINKA
jgi:hypothetical protein